MLNVVDLSSNNGLVNIGALKRAGADAVIIKATEGTGYTNPYFASEVRQAVNAGLCIGTYHFFSGASVTREIAHYWAVVRPYAKYIGLHFADYEGTAVILGGVGYGKTALDLMQKITGKKPWLYTGLGIENSYNWSSCIKYPLWVAQYNDMNKHYGFNPRRLYGRLRNWHKLGMFQYSSTSVIAGYYPLDVSIFYGTKKDWNQGISSKGGGITVENWHSEVKFSDLGAFKVTKKAGANFWNDANNAKKLGHADKGKIYRITKTKNGFYKIAGHDKWLDGRVGQFKANPVAYSNRIHAKIIVKHTTAGHKDLTTKVTGKKFPVSSAWHMFGYDTFKTKSSAWHWALVGAGNNRYINLDKCRVIV